MVREPFSSRDKAVEFDYNGLLSPNGKSGLFCLSETTWQLCFNLIQGYGTWRSRYFVTDEDTGEALTITDEEFDQVVDLIDIATEELIMPCELGPAIEKLGEMILELGKLQLQVAVNVGGDGGDCGCPPGGLGPLPPDPAPPLNTPGGEDPPPDGFDTWEEYQTYKCQAANKIADDLVTSTGNLGSLYGVVGAIQAVLLASFLNTSLLGGVLAGVIALGFSEFAAAGIIIGALIALIVASAGGLVWFSTLANNMDENKQDLVCALYAALSPDDAITAWKEFVIARIGDASGAWSGEPAEGLISSTMETVLNALANLTVVNLLFELDETIAEYEGEIDCGGCSPVGCPYTINYGSGSIRYDGLEFTLNSEDIGGGVHYLEFQINDVDCTAQNWCLNLAENPDLDDTATNYTRYWFATDNDVRHYHQIYCDFAHAPYNGNFPEGTFPNSLWAAANNAPFSVSFRVFGAVGPSAGNPLTESTVCE